MTKTGRGSCKKNLIFRSWRVTRLACFCLCFVALWFCSPSRSADLAAVGDYAYTVPGQPVTINLLANDQDAQTNQMAILQVTSPAHGSIQINTNGQSPNAELSRVFEFTALQLSNSVSQVANTNLYPRSTRTNGTWILSNASDWIPGFFPGAMWYQFEQNADPHFRTWAENWTAGIASQQYVTTTFDLGFMINNSFGQGLRLTGNPSYIPVITNAAHSMLVTGYNPAVGSLGIPGASNTFAVITDASMDSEILFNASRLTGDRSLYLKASNHIARTVLDHIRPDGSTWQQVIYNATNGAVISKGTRAGASPTSTWARGHAWATYGFIMGYRETGNLDFLAAAQRVADYYIANVPADQVPYWDFQAPGIPNAPRDSSAAAITLSALIQISQLATNLQDSARYWQAANRVFNSLASTNYLAQGSRSSGLLLHGTGEPPGFENPEVDVSLIYGDYYFVEALRRFADTYTRTTVTYVPEPGFQGSDTFTYQVCDSAGNCTSATATVVVDPALTNAFTAQISLLSGSLLPTISFPAVTGHLYSVLYADSLKSTQTWNNLATNLIGSGALISITDSNAPMQRYYRVGLE